MEYGPHFLTLLIITSIIVFALIYHIVDINSKKSQFTNIEPEDKDDFIHKLFISTSIQSTSGWPGVEPKTTTLRLFSILQMGISIFAVFYFASYIMLKKTSK